MNALLEIRGLRYSYPDGTAALDGVDLSVPRVSRTALLGENGSGKSTLLHVLGGLLRPGSGEYLYAGEKVSYGKKDLNRLFRRVGLVFQDPDVQLFAPTVYQEVAFGPGNFGRTGADLASAVEGALAAAAISDLRDRPPHFLSYGQKKRVALADILALETETVLFDEPLAWVDFKGREKILSAMEDLHRRGKTLIVSSHDPEFAFRWADRVVIMKNGRIALAGETGEVFRRREALAEAGIDEPLCCRLARELGLPEVPADTERLVRLLKSRTGGN